MLNDTEALSTHCSDDTTTVSLLTRRVPLFLWTLAIVALFAGVGVGVAATAVYAAASQDEDGGGGGGLSVGAFVGMLIAGIITTIAAATALFFFNKRHNDRVLKRNGGK